MATAEQPEAAQPTTFNCSSCNVSGDIGLQRAHYKSDLHRLNLKRALAKRRPLEQKDLDEGYVSNESLSGSASSSSSSEEEEQLRNKSPKILVVEESTGRRLTVWRASITRETEPRELVLRAPTLRELRPSHAAIFMCSGGHFAGVIMQLQEEAVLQHKTVHRYTTRRKAGGSQSVADAQSGGHKAKSAGATLRRYGEAALAQDVRDLAAAWRPDLDRCGLIFLAVSFSHRGIFFEGGDKAPFDPRDPRLRRVPFMTRRPTFAEARRVLQRLAQADAVPAGPDDDVDSLAARLEQSGALGAPPRPATRAAKEREKEKEKEKGAAGPSGQAQGAAAVAVRLKPRTAEEAAEAAGVRLERAAESALWAAVGRGDAGEIERLACGEEGGGEAADVNAAFEDERGMTCLHRAAQEGAADVVALLLELGASPCLTDLAGRVPYALAKDTETRNAFRRHWGAHPDAWDWRLAKVPSPLTDAAERAKAEREREKRKAKAKRAAEARRAKAAEEAAARERQEAEARRREEAERVRGGPAGGGLPWLPMLLAALAAALAAARWQRR